MDNRRPAGGLRRYLPILVWLPSYRAEWLRLDAVAALSVWALLVPQGIAYATIAGVPAQYGLYAALGALVGYALFGTAGQVVTGPSAAIAAVSASVVALWASAGSAEWTSYTATLAFSAGAIYVLLGWLRMGWVSHFLSGAVLGGFVFGFGIGLIVHQMPKILGIPGAEGSYFDVLVGVIRGLPETSMPTFLVGVGSIALLLLMRRFTPKWPRTILVVAIGIIISAVLGLEDNGVAVVGQMPEGLPSIVMPSMPSAGLLNLVLGSLAVIFIGFSESLAAAREVGSKHDYEIDASQEMVAQGAANVGSSILGGYAVEGSLSKTTIADQAGQKTQMASLITAGLIILTVLFLTGLFETMPDAVLGAVVIDAGISLVKPGELRHYQLSRRDFAGFVSTALVVFFVGVLVGVIAGITVSLLLLIASASRTPTRLMGFDHDEGTFVRADHHPDADLDPGIVVAAIDGPLFFADADNFRSSVEAMVREHDPHTVVIDMRAVTVFDLDGDKALAKLSEALQRMKVRVLLAVVSSDQLELMDETGTLDSIGSHNVYRTVHAAAAEARLNRGDSDSVAEV